MKTLIVCFFILVTSAHAQTGERDTLFDQSKEVDTLFAKVSSPVFSIGISGGVTFINPDVINDQIEFNNGTFDSDQPPIRTPGQFALWVAFRPKNVPTYFSVRGEVVMSSRTFPYTGVTTNDTGATTGTFNGSAVSRYSLYPLSFNVGGVFPKTRMKMEIGFVYAFAVWTDKTGMGPYGSTETSYEGEGYGFRVAAQQVVPIDKNFGITIEAGYRYLKLDQFRDGTGRQLESFEANYNGVTLMMGISYGM